MDYPRDPGVVTEVLIGKDRHRRPRNVPEVEGRTTGFLALKMEEAVRQRWPSEGQDTRNICSLPPRASGVNTTRWTTSF